MSKASGLYVIEPLCSYKNVDLATYDDAPELQNLLEDEDDAKLMFNTCNVYEKIHDCFMTLKIFNNDKEAVGGLFLEEYPHVPSVPNDEWVCWLTQMYGLKDVRSNNCFWVHLAAYNPLYRHVFMQPAVRHVFNRFPRKQYMIFIVPAGCSSKFGYLDNISTRIYPLNHRDENKVQTLRLLVRYDFCTNYKVRRAVEEDNDDLVPLIDSYNPRLKEYYGEYYIAEIITRHPDAGRQLIVAEYKGLAVSVLGLSEHVNYQDLNRAFNLAVFTYLLKAPVDEENRRATADRSISSFKEVKLERLSSVDLQVIDDVSSEDEEYPLFEMETSFAMQTGSELSFDLSLPVEPNLKPLEQINHSFSEALIHTELNQVSEENLSQTPMPLYQGEGNAFTIEILASQPEHRESLVLLLEAAFECYPNKDYCILMLPSDQEWFHPLHYFVRATPKRQCFHPHELYLAHRSILNNPSVIEAVGEECLELVENFSSHLKRPDELITKYKNSLYRPSCTLRTFVLEVGTKEKLPVGIMMVNVVHDFDTLKLKYALGTWTDITCEKNDNVGVIEYFCVSPLFKLDIRFFLREVHFRTYRTLLYAMNRFDASKKRTRPMPSVLQTMFLVPARNIVTSSKPLKTYDEDPFALYIVTPRLTGMSRHEVNTKIVIVGSAYTAISFLRTLMYTRSNRNVVFNGIMLVSTDGLVHGRPRNELTDLMFVRTSTIDFESMERMNLRNATSVVTGTLTSINRKAKTITVNYKYSVPYDYLILMSGCQYSVPRKADVKDYLSVALPHNMFTINTETDALNALIALKHYRKDVRGKSYNVVVYGHCLEAYCCINALIAYGVPGINITLIEPYENSSNHNFVIQDGDVYEAVIRQIEAQEVAMLTGYKLIDWSSELNEITLKFESKLRFIEMTALCVFVYPRKTVNVPLYRAIQQAGLVFDGKLVIGPDFRTNDPCIYAAGPLTKYSRRYYADHLAHKYFNSEEIGDYLGHEFRAKLMTKVKDVSDVVTLQALCDQQRGKSVIRVFEKPLITYCRLPGELYYLNVCKPGKTMPLETAMADDDYGSVYATGNCKNLKLGGYFRIHLNTCNIVETITCLALHKFDYKKLILLWGKHEALLNNLVKRFENVNVRDLYAYFELPWCSAIFHDDFPTFEKELMRIMISKSDDEGTSPAEDLLKLYQKNNFKPLTKEQYEEIRERFADSSYETMVTDKLMDFIKRNFNALDMYAHPVIVNYLLTPNGHSPLFTDL